MKILYIGPYRSEMSIGHSSRNIISSLAKISDLTIRPIYIQNNNNYNLDINTNKLEEKHIQSCYDIIVQHSVPGLLVSLYDHINTKIKNIAIPIINKTINKKQYSIALSDFDNILVDDETTQSMIISSYGINNVDIFSYDVTNIDKDKNKINLDIHNNNKKFYFIGSFYANKTMIQLIITSFYFTFAGSSDVSLVLFITETGDQIKQEIDKMITDIKKQLNILTNNNLHKIILKTLSEEDASNVHNTCDIYISLFDSGIESNINKRIAQAYNNIVIDESNTNMLYDINQGYGDTYFFGELKLTTNIVSLSDSMIRALGSTANNDTIIPTIDKIICQ